MAGYRLDCVDHSEAGIALGREYIFYFVLSRIDRWPARVHTRMAIRHFHIHTHYH